MFRRRIAVYTTAHRHVSVPRHCSTGPLHLTIGDITVSVPTRVAHPERVGWALPGADLLDPLDADPLDPLKDPTALLDELPSMHGGCAFFQLQDPTTRGYLRWICQKERLRQDMCLIGEPGPAMRWLVRMYSYLVRREVQFLALNRDTTESDLGQRREMRNGTLIYDDQCVVVAAREGQLLLLEGLERAERNVLPVINNLLENREMPLEDGSMLIHPDRYDRLLQERLNGRREIPKQSHTETDAAQLAMAHEELRRMGFIRVSENFRVIGITVPVPPFDGNPLDPPLRSRFQCLYVNVPLHTGALNTTTKSSSSSSSSSPLSSLRAFSLSSARAESLLRLRTAIDEVNASTRSFEADRANQNADHTASGTGSNSSGNSHIRSAGGLPTIGSYEFAVLERQLRLFRDIPVGDVLTRSFPWHILAQQTVASSGAAHVEEATRRRKDYERLLSACNITVPFFEKQKQLREQEAAAAASAAAREHQWGIRGKRSQKNADPQPEQFNYIEAFQDVRNHGPSGGVIADARIASLHGPYTLPIHLGAAALSLPLSELSPSGSAVMRSCPTPAHLHTLQLMLQLHIAGQHILLLGPTGCGKTTLVHAFARALGQRTESMYLYADMTHKDLFQRRAMDGPSGDTAWRNSALVDAAVTGHIAVLDGVDKVPAGMLASLQQLLIDGCATLCDGTVLVPRREYEYIRARLAASDEVMRQRRVFPVHPAFRVIATARPPENTTQSSPRGQAMRWRLSHDATSLFGIVTMPDATSETLRAVMDRVASAATGTAPVGGSERLLALRDALLELRRAEPKVPQLSLRQLLHLARLHERYPDDFAPGVESALLLPLMPSRTAALVRQVMREKGLDAHDHSQEWSEAKGGTRAETPRQLREGRRSRRHEVLEEVSNEGEGTRVFALHGEPIIRFTRVYTERERSLVPYVTRFHTNPVHESIIAWLAKQYALGSNILLIGNQGVGKNKVVDAFLSRIRVPRQYIQLHRDTTVSSLTINPIVEGGRVMWEDSPLVKAVQLGHCLVVDEIDKAPVEVVQVLKGLIEDHEMRLRDGRQIRGPKAYAMLCSSTHNNNNDNNNNKNSIHGVGNQRSMPGQGDNNNNSNATTTTNKNDGNRTFPHHEFEEGQVIQMHPDFRIIVLANPPGYPFHGNDFYRECGDLFASYVMGNPDSLSQLRVLRAYGPGVPDAILVRLISAFESFQRSFEEGHLTYPFSLRELIAVVQHIAAFPQDGIYEALNNVFNFDARDENTLQLVRRVLHLHLSPLVSGGGVRRLLPLRIGHPLPLQVLPQPLNVPTTPVLVLPARIVSHDENQPYPPVVQAVPTWREIYSEADFASRRESGDSRDNVVTFTEWSATICLPFLRPGDKVLAVAASAASAAADHETGMPATLATLFARPTEGEEKCDQLMFAVVAPPSVRAIGIGATAHSCGPPPGTAQLYDLTGLLFPRQRDSNAGGAEKWSLQLSAVSLEAHASVEGSGDAEEAQFFTIVDATTGVAVLVNPSAPTREIEENTNAQVREHVGEEPEKMDGSKGPVGGVLLLRVAPPVTDSHAEAALAVRPESGIIAMARDADVFLWIDDHRVVVTMPSPVVQLHFFTANLASVQMSSGACGVLKVTIAPGGIVHASFCPLPEAVAGTVVDIVPMNTCDNASEESEQQANDHSSAKDSSETDRSAPLTPSALKGAVVVPSGPAARGDVAYMTFDTYASESKSWSVRVFTDATAAAAARSGVLRVDTARHQLVMTAASPGDASNNYKSSSGQSQSVVAVDTRRHTMRRFGPMPPSTSPATSSSSSPLSHEGPRDSTHFALSAPAGALLRYDTVSQRLDVADVSAERVEQRYHRWSSLLEGSAQNVGTAAPRSPPHDVPMGYSRSRKNPSGSLKHGKEDGKEHHGGNTYAGGTGGTDTAGLGGLVGPYRLDMGFPVHQVSPEDKRKVPPHILEEARRMGREALAERLKEIGMSAKEYEQYRAMQERVRGPVGLLRSVLGGLKAAEGERAWMRGQTDGIWDDSKIVEGTVGERNIYKRRVDSTETNPFQAKYKKRLLFVLDVSASMYRFEGMDHRLSKLLESTVMVMEAFAGFEEKIDYSLVGHNGDNACIQLVPFGQPPTNQKARMEICRRMIAYSQYCWSGDNTVEAMRHSVDLVTTEKGDAYLVFVISDANLHRYGIEPRDLREIMLSHKEVQMFCIFIATIGEQASNLQAELPTGHGFECMRTDALPHILKQIFMSVNLF